MIIYHISIIHYHCESAQLDLYIGIPDFQTGHSTQISRIQHFNQVWPQKVLKFDESPSCRLYTAHSIQVCFRMFCHLKSNSAS